MCQQCKTALINEIHLHGVSQYDIEPHGSHRTLRFTFNGNKVMLVFGTNPSDRHHLQNALSDLRRAMGVKRIVTKRRAARPSMLRSRPRAAPPVLPSASAAPLADPWAPLRGLAEKHLSAPALPPTPAIPPPAPRLIRLCCPQFGRRPRWHEVT